MFCNQCQETAGNTGCTTRGVCGKEGRTANLQDLLVYSLIGLARYLEISKKPVPRPHGAFIARALFATITNANFDDQRIIALIREAAGLRAGLKQGVSSVEKNHDVMTWTGETDEEIVEKSVQKGIAAYSSDADEQSLKRIILYGLKGLAAYADHADVLGFHNDDIYLFMVKALAALSREHSVDELTALVVETGGVAVAAMKMLDEANTSTYGHPEITSVNTGVRKNPGILVSGHDLKDMEELLKQTEGTGIDVYTHGEMLPTHYYPAFKKYSHLAGNYGGSWWKQGAEFSSFNGPILMTTNCITPVKKEYANRIFTTGMTGYPGVEHIGDSSAGQAKDFSRIIQRARTCAPPQELEQGTIVGGFAHHQVLALADKVVAAVRSGAIKKFVIMAGCDGRHKSRVYFEEVAKALPRDAVILTAGCAKYRYIKLALGDINGIPRVLDAGQCNDSYSLAVIALKLKEVFALSDVNELPIAFDIAWYEQKAVAVLLALLYLGFKGIRLGPTLPAFLTPRVTQVLVDAFGITPTGAVAADVRAIMADATRPAATA